MNTQNATVVIATAPAKYLQQQASRKRFSFGPVWNKAVIEGNITDTNKLVAQAVKLKCGKKSDLKRIKFSTLLAKVQAKLIAEQV